jgi:Gas vesicle protein K
MTTVESSRVDSDAMTDFARVMESAVLAMPYHGPDGGPATARLNLDPENVKNGLAQLVLTLVKLLHELLEKQAVRRIDAGSLSEQQIERLGLTLMRQAEEIERLRTEFRLGKDDLNLDLGPLGNVF